MPLETSLCNIKSSLFGGIWGHQNVPQALSFKVNEWIFASLLMFDRHVVKISQEYAKTCVEL